MCKMKTLAIIPARSGSKGIKNKNIVDLNGKPMMAYSIESAIKSKIFDEVMVSTDSQDYADIAARYGAKIPFIRSEMTSSDEATTEAVVKEVLENYRKDNISFDAFCILQPTSPLRTSEDIINAYKIFCEKSEVAVVSVCEVDHSPLISNVLPENHSLNGFIKCNGTRRQNMDTYYRINGALYFAYVDEYLKDSNFYREGSYAYIMDKRRSIDVDDDFDLNICRLLITNKD